MRALNHKEGRTRSIAAQLLCNLAKSDPERRMLRDFDALFAVTADPKFVTARHALQAIWRIGTVGKKHQSAVVDALAGRFSDCAAEKNCTLIRYDIIQCLRRLYDSVKDDGIRQKALQMIATEPDAKYPARSEALLEVRQLAHPPSRHVQRTCRNAGIRSGPRNDDRSPMPGSCTGVRRRRLRRSVPGTVRRRARRPHERYACFPFDAAGKDARIVSGVQKIDLVSWTGSEARCAATPTVPRSRLPNSSRMAS